MGLYGSPVLGNTETNKNMLYCVSCGFCYSKKLKKCPQCGKKRSQSFYHKWWFWLLLVIMFCSVSSSPSSNETVNKQTSTTNSNTNLIEIEENKEKTHPTTNQVAISEEDYKAQCVNIPYIDIARNPNNYIGQYTKFRGKVIQVQESGKNIILRINVTEGQYGIWDDTIYVDYRKKSDTESRILEEDVVTLFGEVNGIKNYTSVLGNQISVPHIKAEYIVIQ